MINCGVGIAECNDREAGVIYTVWGESNDIGQVSLTASSLMMSGWLAGWQWVGGWTGVKVLLELKRRGGVDFRWVEVIRCRWMYGGG